MTKEKEQAQVESREALRQWLAQDNIQANQWPRKR